ncbi:MAG: helix-turn-helix domain-containing protein [Clostridia bacterium]|nr:helix-turn-helix domain-containing protein [Clostridia bacterium]
MLNNNIKRFRKIKGISQEELATKLNVVRQTVSKWETGLSVPDAEMLTHIADVLDTSVNALLDEETNIDENSKLDILDAKLSFLNNQVARHNEQRRKTWRIIFITISVVTACILLSSLVEFIHLKSVMHNIEVDTTIIGGADGPTNILVSNKTFNPVFLVGVLAVAALSVIGIYKTRKK